VGERLVERFNAERDGYFPDLIGSAITLSMLS
jgi:hypothetical protein